MSSGRIVTVIFLLISRQIQWEEIQPVLMFVYVVQVLFEDFRGLNVIRFNISTAYAFLLALTSVSHMIALFGWDSNPYYFAKFYSPELAGRAIFIFNIGSIVITETMRWYLLGKPESLYGLFILKK